MRLDRDLPIIPRVAIALEVVERGGEASAPA
jgi:hypothetical protein